MCFINHSTWHSQGVGQHCLSGKDRLIYQHSAFSNNILMSLSQVCAFWYQASHCLKHFGEMLLTLQAYFFQKMPELSWQSLFGLLTYLFFLLYSAKKVPCICHWRVYRPSKERPPSFVWLNANSVCGHEFIKQINTTHLLVVVLRKFQHWYINSFLDSLWPPLSCAIRITGNTRSNLVVTEVTQVTALLSSQDTTKILPSVAKSKDPLGFFASVVLPVTGVPWKRFCRRVPSALIPSSVSSSNKGSEVNKLSCATIDPACTSHFSIKPNTTSAPWSRAVSDKSVSTPQYGSAWRTYPSDEVTHQSLNPNLMGFFLINSFLPCFP